MYPWPYQLKNKQTNKKTVLLDFMDRDGEKGIFHISGWIPHTRKCVNWPKQWNYIWFSSCNWSHHLVTFTIIHYHFPRSFCPLHRPNRLAEWECGDNDHFCSFPVLDGSTNLSNLSSSPVLLSAYCFTGERQFQWLPLGPSHHNNPHSTGKGTHVVIMLSVKYACFNYTSCNLENHHQKGLGIHWIHCEMDRG